MYTHPHFRQFALWHRALGNERRLAILEKLSRQEMNAVEIAEYLGIRPSAASRHIALLHRAGCIVGQRHSSEVIFRLCESSEVRQVVNMLHQLMKR